MNRKPYTKPRLLKRDARCVHSVFSEGGNLTPLQRIDHVPGCACDGLSETERTAITTAAGENMTADAIVLDMIAWVQRCLSHEAFLSTADVVNVCLVAMDAAEESGDLDLRTEYRTAARIILIDSFAEAYRERMDAAFEAHGRHAGARVLAARVLADWRRSASQQMTPPPERRQALLQGELRTLGAERCRSS